MDRRGGGDRGMTHSSIALLQERFRQLQREKQLREERALLRVLSESERVGPAMNCNEPSSRLFFHSEMTPPLVPPTQSFLSSQAELQSENDDTRVVDARYSRNLRNANRSIVHASSTHKDSDVDTSLHL
ncbi:hypothetical protein Sjap_002823 [Stephania japonica]|uniref:Uncharacterized protein n=1 Tax=Stephania japonica TaxID=461633 RepID=A0AAP0KP44_9MAGN